ncbi:MAG: hypothetical protein QOC55_2570 [Thermoleophilaceae bacterium]|nr:hypothetical protein [Thermoleophilaceae bacterium]
MGYARLPALVKSTALTFTTPGGASWAKNGSDDVPTQRAVGVGVPGNEVIGRWVCPTPITRFCTTSAE